jgi:hypothetical protein
MPSASDSSSHGNGGGRRTSLMETFKSAMAPNDLARRRASSSASFSSMNNETTQQSLPRQQNQVTFAMPPAAQPHRDATDVGSQFLEYRTPGRQQDGGWVAGWGLRHRRRTSSLSTDASSSAATSASRRPPTGVMAALTGVPDRDDDGMRGVVGGVPVSSK